MADWHCLTRLTERLAFLIDSWAGERWKRIRLVVSPVSGGFAARSARRRLIEWLTSRGSASSGSGRVSLHTALYSGHPRVIGRELVDGEENEGALVVSAGGDGAHQELISGLLDSGKDRLPAVLRLPFGTGNDGADISSLDDLAAVLHDEAAMVKIPAVRCTTARGDCHYAFNIASFGIDAFVTGLTNYMKGILPGDVYKLIADASPLVYEPIFGRRGFRLNWQDELGRYELDEPFLFVAFGASGRRTYGDHKRILPGEENVCAVRTRSLREKMVLKQLIYEGRHLGSSGVYAFRTDRLEIACDHPLPLQVDGQARVMHARDFPCLLERVTSGVLSPRQPGYLPQH